MEMMKPKQKTKPLRNVSSELSQIIFRLETNQKKALKLKLIKDNLTLQTFFENCVEEYLTEK